MQAGRTQAGCHSLAARRPIRGCALCLLLVVAWMAPIAATALSDPSGSPDPPKPRSLPGPQNLSGWVRDADTGQPVARAAVALRGAAAAALSDSTGAFRLTARALPAILAVERAGYRPLTLTVSGPLGGPLELSLTPDPYEMAEIVVLYEDPARRIMREVIRRKREWQARQHSWTATAYTRQTLYADTRIVALREQCSRWYSDRKRGEREVALAGRHSAAVPPALQYFAARSYFANLYDDEIELLGQRVLGPTHPEALDHYRFELIETRPAEGDSVYEISVRPRGALRTVLAGYLLVRQSTAAVIEAGLSAAPPIVTPKVPSRDGLRLRFVQRFAPFAGGVQLPVDLEYEIDAHLGTSALGERVLRWRNDPTPRARLQGRCHLSAHRVNARISDFVYQSPGPLEVDGLASADSLEPPEEAALTLAEERAYAYLEGFPDLLVRSPVLGLFALHPGLPRSGAPADEGDDRADPLEAESLVSGEVVVAAVQQGLGLPVPQLPDGDWVPEFAPEAWYNRVEGLHAGGRARLVPGPPAGLFLKGGYDLGLERLYGGASLSLGQHTGPTLTASYASGARTTYASDTYSLAVNSFPVLLGIGDYYDYYWSRGWRLEAGRRPVEGGPGLRLGLNLEEHSSLTKSTDFDLLCDFQPESGRFYKWVCDGRNSEYRANPSIRAGRLRFLDVGATWGAPYVPRGRAANRRLEVRAEAAGGLLGGDFDFGRFQLTADGHWETFLRRRAGGGALDVRLVAAATTGKAPPQRLAALDAAIWRLTPFGGFRARRDRPLAGGQVAGLFWEHDFGAAPFEALGLGGLARAGYGLVLHGASGRAWDRCAGCGDRSTSHHELGLSWVVDGRWRLDATRRLDRPGWWVGFSKARIGR